MIEPLQSARIDPAALGGKAANLARLVQSGFPVPAGFVLTTAAYQSFTAFNHLNDQLPLALSGISPGDVQALESASANIRALFSAGSIPEETRLALGAAYRAMGSPAVAVRSSATAEDLPDLSFAGQQDTYLNVRGEDFLFKAVVDCWSSLWTARAIGYRIRSGISDPGLALAVVVQRMVPAEAAGVMFTANPLSGQRTRIVIDAALGLGEALVSGQVEPDHYEVDGKTWHITGLTIGAKAVSSRLKPEGGTELVIGSAVDDRALNDEEVIKLAQLGQQIEKEFGFPQDVEWAVVGGKISILQSRPITSLFPVPNGMSNEPLEVLFSFGAVQGMLDPMTPLGMDFLRHVFALGGRLLGYHYQDASLQPTLKIAGERLWIRITPIFCNEVGRKVLQEALKLVEPTVKQALMLIWDDPQLKPLKRGVSFSARRHLVFFAAPMMGRVLLNMLFPTRRREMIIRKTENILINFQKTVNQAVGSPQQALAKQLERFLEVASQIPGILALFLSAVIGGMASINLLNRLAAGIPGISPGPGGGWPDLVLNVTRGMPNNPTSQMDLDLWEAARIIRNNPESSKYFQQHSVEEMAAGYLTGNLPTAAQEAVRLFMERYGLRGLAEIDLGRPRWHEEPAHILQVIGSYLQMDDSALAPDLAFKRGAQVAVEAAAELASRLRKQRLGWLKAPVSLFLANRVRAWLGLREAPKFFAVRLMGILRQAILVSGAGFVRLGLLNQPGDMLFMYVNELQELAAGGDRNWKSLVEMRRSAYLRELTRRQVPRLLLSDGRAFYEGLTSGPDSGSLIGSPVSPGTVEGLVRVVLDPRKTRLAPGEILVCPGTDPSWTPLFLAAGGLIMEVGGMMTHGAVVAREYGIPAVVGVHQATECLKTGQRIRLNGSTGQIQVLE